MNSITFKELEKKIKAGESIEEIAKDHWVDFFLSRTLIPDFIPVEQLIEIIEKAPELLTKDHEIPGWLFLLFLAREKFNILDNIVSDIFEKNKKIVKYQREENISSRIVCNTLSTIKQITKEQISVLLSIMEKRKNLFFKYSKKKNADYFFWWFLKPISGYLSKECFLPIFNWMSKETNPYFFKRMEYDFFKELPMKNPLIQGKLVDYFIKAHPLWLIPQPNERFFDLFNKKEKLELLDEKFFVSSVVKSYSRLNKFKKIYLLNFPYFLENYPQLAVKSLKILMDKPNYQSMSFILEENKIFIPDKIWDILLKKDPLFFLDLIKRLPVGYFFFNVTYVSKKAKLACFINPESLEEVYTRLKKLRKSFAKMYK